MIMTVIFVMLAAMCNAVMDITTHHFYDSIFTYNNRFWDPEISWKNKYNHDDPKYGRRKWHLLFFMVNIHPAFTDGWHLMKSSMIVFLMLAIQFYSFHAWYDFIILGTCWNVTFSIMYNYGFRKNRLKK